MTGAIAPGVIKPRAGYDISVVPGSWSVRSLILEPVTTCDFCGKQEPDEAKTLTWSTAVENGRLRRYCDECSRTHLRAMEGKLDSEYW